MQHYYYLLHPQISVLRQMIISPDEFNRMSTEVSFNNIIYNINLLNLDYKYNIIV